MTHLPLPGGLHARRGVFWMRLRPPVVPEGRPLLGAKRAAAAARRAQHGAAGEIFLAIKLRMQFVVTDCHFLLLSSLFFSLFLPPFFSLLFTVPVPFFLSMYSGCTGNCAV